MESADRPRGRQPQLSMCGYISFQLLLQYRVTNTKFLMSYVSSVLTVPVTHAHHRDVVIGFSPKYLCLPTVHVNCLVCPRNIGLTGVILYTRLLGSAIVPRNIPRLYATVGHTKVHSTMSLVDVYHENRSTSIRLYATHWFTHQRISYAPLGHCDA